MPVVARAAACFRQQLLTRIHPGVDGSSGGSLAGPVNCNSADLDSRARLLNCAGPGRANQSHGHKPERDDGTEDRIHAKPMVQIRLVQLTLTRLITCHRVGPSAIRWSTEHDPGDLWTIRMGRLTSLNF